MFPWKHAIIESGLELLTQRLEYSQIKMWATSLQQNMKTNFYKMCVVLFLAAAINRRFINLDSGGRSWDPEEALGVQALLLNVTDELRGEEEDSLPSENA